MDNMKIFWYYRSSNYSWLVWKFMVLDNELRSLFHIGYDCGFITVITTILTVVIFVYALMSIKVAKSNKTLCQALQNEASEKLPRKRSILSVRPGYNCIHKHLQQTDVFQDKAKRTLHKEHLEIELMKSRISCMNKLLEPNWVYSVTAEASLGVLELGV